MATRSKSVVVRKPRPADAAALVEVSRQSWRTAYQGMIPASSLHRALAKRNTDWWLRAIANDPNLLVLDVAGTVAGYATCGRARCGFRGAGEIHELYVAPHYQGMGLGELLFEASRALLDRMALPRLVVWAIADNDQAKRFYFCRGGREFATSVERFEGARVNKVGFLW